MNIEDLEEILNKRIIEAYSLGYSVVEITRALRKTGAEFVHSLLRETGHIPAMARSEYRRQYDIDHRMSAALRRKGLSFGRWCLGWKLDPLTAAVDLKAAPAEGDTVSAHTALQRDFPDVYFSLFGGKRIRKGRGRRSPARPISFRVDWDVERNSFVATVPEYPLIEARGGDWDEAFYALKTACRLQEYILRLDRLVAPPEKV